MEYGIYFEDSCNADEIHGLRGYEVVHIITRKFFVQNALLFYINLCSEREVMTKIKGIVKIIIFS